MIVDDFHAFGPSVAPDEADPPLVVDANAVLTGAASFQKFEPVDGWSCQIHELFRLVDLAQLPLRHSLDVRTEPTSKPTFEQRCRVAIGKRTRRVLNVKRICVKQVKNSENVACK